MLQCCNYILHVLQKLLTFKIFLKRSSSKIAKIHCSNIFKFLSIGIFIIVFTIISTLEVLLFESLFCRFNWWADIFWSDAVGNNLPFLSIKNFVMLIYSDRFYMRNEYMLVSVLIYFSWAFLLVLPASVFETVQ